MRLTKQIMRMGKPRHSFSRTAALLALGAAVGAGMTIMRSPRTEQHQVANGGGPVESDF